MAERLELPWPPTLNTYRSVVRGRLITSTKGKKYKKDCYWLIKEQSKAKFDCPVKVRMYLHPPTLAKYDVDNYCKALFDAISESGFWKDDSLICELLITKEEKVKSGKVVLEIKKALSGSSD